MTVSAEMIIAIVVILVLVVGAFWLLLQLPISVPCFAIIDSLEP